MSRHSLLQKQAKILVQDLDGFMFRFRLDATSGCHRGDTNQKSCSSTIGATVTNDKATAALDTSIGPKAVRLSTDLAFYERAKKPKKPGGKPPGRRSKGRLNQPPPLMTTKRKLLNCACPAVYMTSRMSENGKVLSHCNKISPLNSKSSRCVR